MKRFVATAALLSTALAGAREPDAMIEWPYVGSGPDAALVAFARPE